MVIVGSTALKHFGIPFRDPADIDMWVSLEQKPEQKQKGYDISVMPDHILNMIPVQQGYATPNAVYTIKCSHLGWNNPMWAKHKSDILHLSKLGCVIIEPLYEELKKYWEVQFGGKDFLSLGKSKDEFFNDHVNYRYDHDWLHEQVAYPERPVYELCLKDGHDVLIDKKKFYALTFEDRVRMFREEITVIAIERWLVHPQFKGSWTKAYYLALEKTITRLTKNWANDFLVRNLKHFYKPDYTYFKHALETINKGDA